MKIKISILLILSLVFLAGCAPPDESYNPIAKPAIVTTTTTQKPVVATPKPTTTTSKTPSNYGDIDITKVAEGSFGVYGSLTINGYQAGLTVDKNVKGYQPLYIINRVNKVSEKKSIQTEPNETIADIPLRRVLHDNDILSVVSISSDLENETLKAEKYNQDGTLTISGFKPDTKRNSVITFIPDSLYEVAISVDASVEQGYVQAPPDVVKWVTFDQEKILIPPDSYAPVWVKLLVPEETKLPDKWEFFVSITLSSGKQSSGVATEIVYQVGIKVDMAG